MTTPVGGVDSNPFGALSNTAASSQTQSAGLDKDAFLKLLVAQLRYQDPGKPLDSSAYMAQMAQFTQVEKLANIEKAQAEISAWQRTVAGEGMVGKEITALGSSGQAISGVVTGMKLGTAGPELLLAGGGMVSVDSVETVNPAPAPSVTQSGVSSTGPSPTTTA